MKRGWCRTGLTLVAAGVLAGSLTACVPLLLGGGAVTTALVASDRRTSGMYLEDERIEQSAAAKLRETLKEGTRASVTSFNRLALVTGEVRSEAEKAEVGRTVASVENVRNVVNEVEVVPFISSIGQRSRDTLLTSQVKASLIDAKDLQANTIKVVTEMNVVYLMGIVTPREAQRAAEIARGVNNVRKVVRVFENISEQELASYNTRQQPAPVEQDPAAK
ncbi:BON domain-containing protein [Comamonas aquatica]|uniref:BON domain-containing protein n=1 Tax=Comamonas aquatica TaxID=225991 RepID=A0A1B2D0R1_9BURK|nr:BON domain-containing protein [Comamonas aquatica]ANY61293.1 transporter [Comamonas aquatica]MDE1554611.1 BON domain-containing protein [Comamonas aquatica]MDH0199683.1 BON domain-containing protein [Comamonas aquatica]MDH0363811.1 BON domain-containing protein [Comamonas aquatica]MDH0370477.1 BON domain-containing protein [Comamonas aquatica]